LPTVDKVEGRRELGPAKRPDEVGIELATGDERGVYIGAFLDLADEVGQWRWTQAVQMRDEALPPRAISSLRLASRLFIFRNVSRQA
jgi:hypothetical protein